MTATALAIVCAAAAGLGWLAQRDARARIRRQLDDPDDREAYATELRRDRFEAPDGGERGYRDRTRRALAWLGSILGERYLFSLHGFGICLSLAVGYAALLFWSSWLLGAPSALPSLNLLPDPDGLSLGRRAFAAAAIVLPLAGLAWMVRRASGATGWRRRGAILGALLLAAAGYGATHLLIGGWYWPSLVDNPSVGVAALYGALAMATALLTAAFSGRPRGAGLAGVALWALVAGIYIVTPDNAVEQLVALLILALPLANALFDWLSWAISRRLITSLTRPDRPATVRRLLIHVGWDLLAALLLLTGLAVSIPWMLEQFALGFASDEIFREAADDPLGAGRWLVMMLVSTLIPTAIHVFAIVVSALEVRRSAARRSQIADLLEDRGGAPGPRALDAAAGFLVTRWRWPAATVFVVLLLVVGPLLWHGPLGRAILCVGEAVGAASRSPDGWNEIVRVRMRRAASGHPVETAAFLEPVTAAGAAMGMDLLDRSAAVAFMTGEGAVFRQLVERLAQHPGMTPQACQRQPVLARLAAARLHLLGRCAARWPDDTSLDWALRRAAVETVLVADAADDSAAPLHALLDEQDLLRLVERGGGGQSALRFVERERRSGLDPGFAHLADGIIYNASWRHAAAVEALQDALEHRPESPMVWAQLARALYHLGEVDEARAAAQDALLRDPSDADLVKFAHHLHDACPSSGLDDCRSPLLEGAFSAHDPLACAASINTLRRILSAGGPDGGIEISAVAADCARRWPHHVEVLDAFAERARYYSGHRAAAIGALETLIEFEPDDPLHRTRLSRQLRHGRRYAEALTHAERAVALAPDFLDAWRERGMALLGLGRFDAARRALLRVESRLTGRRYNDNIALAVAELAGGDPAAARRRLRADRVVLTPDTECLLAHLDAAEAGDAPPTCRYLPPPPRDRPNTSPPPPPSGASRP